MKALFTVLLIAICFVGNSQKTATNFCVDGMCHEKIMATLTGYTFVSKETDSIRNVVGYFFANPEGDEIVFNYYFYFDKTNKSSVFILKNFYGKFEPLKRVLNQYYGNTTEPEKLRSSGVYWKFMFDNKERVIEFNETSEPDYFEIRLH